MTERLEISVHQALHGYADGHRELSSSVRLKPRDARTVSVMSDVSSSGLRVPHVGYLTGYPLQDSGTYVVARTWTAPEASRPGAVWTHSLLIEFTDLAQLSDARALLPLFRRPDVGASGFDRSYSSPVTASLRNSSSVEVAAVDLEGWTRGVMISLYGNPNDRVVAIAPPESSDALEHVVLSLWSQQWPRLRRTFRFCTLTLADRPADKTPFDLQLCPDGERSVRHRFPGAIVASNEQLSTAWLDDAYEDLQRRSPTPLREFFLAVGGAAKGGRRDFAPLTWFHRLVSASEISSNAANSAIEFLEAEFDGPGTVATELLVAACARSIQQLDAKGQEFVVNHLNLLSQLQADAAAQRIGIAIWHMSRLRLAELLNGTANEKLVALRALMALDQSELIEGFSEAPALAPIAIQRRPDLVGNRLLWSSSEVVVESGLQFLRHDLSSASDALRTIFTIDSPTLRSQVILSLPQGRLWSVFAQLAEAEPRMNDVLRTWLRALSQNTSAVAQVLVDQVFNYRSSLCAIAQSVAPDAVPNEYGDDPWLIANGHVQGSIDASDAVFFSSYLLTRALGLSSRNRAGLIEAAFDNVYEAAGHATIPEHCWALLSPRLPQPSSWQSWDRCMQLRKAVAQLYVHQGLSPASFANLGRHEEVFRDLVKAAAKESHGRDFLREVRRALERHGVDSTARIEVIKDQLRFWSL